MLQRLRVLTSLWHTYVSLPSKVGGYQYQPEHVLTGWLTGWLLVSALILSRASLQLLWHGTLF